MRSGGCTARATRSGASPPRWACTTGPSSVTSAPTPARTGAPGVAGRAAWIGSRTTSAGGSGRGAGTPGRSSGELQGMGYRGGKTALRVYVRRVEAESGPPRPRRPPALAPRIDVPSARGLAVSVVRRPDGRSAEDRRWLEMLGEDGGEVGEAIGLAGKFAALIRGRVPGELTDWLVRAEGSSVAGLRSFARGLRQDEAAVRAGVTVEWSNGPVEGQVNRLKVIKRSMYGRARFDLLKARVLHAELGGEGARREWLVGERRPLAQVAGGPPWPLLKRDSVDVDVVPDRLRAGQIGDARHASRTYRACQRRWSGPPARSSSPSDSAGRGTVHVLVSSGDLHDDCRSIATIRRTFPGRGRGQGYESNTATSSATRTVATPRACRSHFSTIGDGGSPDPSRRPLSSGARKPRGTVDLSEARRSARCLPARPAAEATLK